MEIHSLCQILTLLLITFLLLQLFWPFLPSQLPFELLIGFSVAFSSSAFFFLSSRSFFLFNFSSSLAFFFSCFSLNTSRHSLLLNTLAVVTARVIDLPGGFGVFGVENYWRMLVVFDVTALFLLAGKWLGKGAAIKSSVVEEVEGAVVSLSITATGFNTGIYSKFSSIELEEDYLHQATFDTGDHKSHILPRTDV